MKTTSSKNIYKLVKIGVVSQVLAQIMVGLLGIVLVKVMTTKLGSHRYGIYATSLALVGTFSLFTDLGINTATLREISKRPDDASDIIGHNLGLRFLISLIAIPLIAFVGREIYPTSTHVLWKAIFIMSTYLIFDAVWSNCVIYYAARLRNDIVAAITVFQEAIFLFFVILAAVFHQNLQIYVLSFVASYALTAVLAYKITGKQISLKPLFNMAIWKKTISLSIVLGAIDILNQIYHMADSIMISIFKSPLQVGIYTVSYSLVGIFLFLPDYVMGNLTPVIIGLKRGPKINRLVGDSSEFLTSIGFLIPLFSYFLGKNMVILVSGRGYINAASPFFILTIGLLFSYVATPYLRTCIALEKQKGLLTCTMSTLALNIIINLYTIPHFGLIGAAIATAISEALSLVLILRISKQHINLSVNVQSILRPLLAALFSFVLLLKIDSIWSTGIIELNLITAAIIISLVYVSLLWLFKGIPSIVRDFAKHTYAKYIRL